MPSGFARRRTNHHPPSPTSTADANATTDTGRRNPLPYEVRREAERSTGPWRAEADWEYSILWLRRYFARATSPDIKGDYGVRVSVR